MINKKSTIFIPGLTERAKDYLFRPISRYMLIHDIDWNTAKIPTKKYKTVIGFSFGAVLACQYALKRPVERLILCSMTPGIEHLKNIKAKHIVFMIGEKELHKDWSLTNYRHICKTLPKGISKTLMVVPGAGHKIGKAYTKAILGMI